MLKSESFDAPLSHLLMRTHTHKHPCKVSPVSQIQIQTPQDECASSSFTSPFL